MTIEEVKRLYGEFPQAAALLTTLEKESVKHLFLKGLLASSSSMLFASIANRLKETVLFVLDDEEQAGYFYNDLKQILGEQRVLYFPSSYKRAVKYGQRDSANEILRTEVLARLGAGDLFVVSYPQALAELVVSKTRLDDRLIKLKTGNICDCYFYYSSTSFY